MPRGRDDDSGEFKRPRPRKEGGSLLWLWLLLGVGGLMLVLGGSGVAVWLAKRPAPSSEVVVRVVVECPGMDAKTVADTVAAPIEQQVNGVEGQTALEPEVIDGRYALTVHFAPRCDRELAELMVRNRVNLALPLLPDAVRDRVRVK